MQKILTAEEMREVDRLTTEKYGIPSILLMENAAHAAARVITEKLGGSVAGKSFLILCGKGNNGGDGAALARILWSQDAWVELVLFGKLEDTRGNARINFNVAKKQLTNFYEFESREDWDKFLYNSYQDWDFLVDAIFGTGLNRPLDIWLGNIIRHTNITNEEPRPFSRKCISIDMPSGLNADTGESIGESFRADITVTFTAPKLANVLPPASNFNGELVIANIGSPLELIHNSPSCVFVAEKSDAQEWFDQTKYSSDSYKNKRGHALLIVGSKEYAGAAVLAGNAAMVSGVGLTTVATSESAQTAVAAKVLEEVITRGLPETTSGAIAGNAFETVEKLIEKVDVVGIGCGLTSTEEATKDFIRRVVEKRKTPVVIDADALNALSPFELKGSDDLPLILTPHEGEFLRLLGTKDKDAIKDRVKAVRDFAAEHKVILVLKGERVLIGAPDGTVVVNPTGNSGLGKAGNGDTLTGIITGFVAQTMQTEHFKTAFESKTAKPLDKVFEAVVAAVYLSGVAGDIAADKFGKRSMLASDVRHCLREAFESVEN